jgi:spore maturation protein A
VRDVLNFIWCFFIVIAIVFGIFNGTYKDVNSAIFSSIENTVELVITLFGSMCFWNGIMNIVKNTSLIQRIKKLLKPIIKIIFKNIDEESKAFEDISMNMTSNLLGLGNAATPCGLKAMEELQIENTNKEKLSNNMILFMLINTASIQLIPTTIISIRMGLNSKNPSGIILGVWFASIVTFVSMLCIAKCYLKFRKNYYKKYYII